MWETVKLGNLYDVGSSKRVLKADWKDEGVPFYRGREITALSVNGCVDNDLFITEEHYLTLSAKSGVPGADDIMITAIGTIGNTYIVEPNHRFYFKDASVLWLRKKADISSRYIQYWLKTDDFFRQLDKGNGATVDTLTIKKLASVELPLPPLSEQQRIVAKLDAAFAEIDRAVAATEKSVADGESLFKAICKKVIGSLQIAPSSLGSIGKVRSGGTPSKTVKEYWGGSIAWYTSAELNNLFTREAKDHISEEGLKSSNAKLFPKGSLLMGMVDTAALKMSILDREAAFNQNICGFMANEKADMQYLYYAITVVKDEVLKSSVGVRQTYLSKTKIEKMQLSIPDLNTQKKIASRIEKILSHQERVLEIYNIKILRLTSLKSAILAQELQPPQSKAA